MATIFFDYCLLFLLASFLVDRERGKSIGRSVDEVNIDRVIYCWVFTLSLNMNLKFGHFTLFGILGDPEAVTGCLHDTGTSFILVRVHPGSYLSLCICLHDTGEKSHTSTTRTGTRFYM